MRKLDWTALGDILQRVDFAWVVLGSASIPVLMAGLALRWRIFLQQQQLAIRFTALFSLTWAGQFFNSVLPGSTGGDVVKIYQLCRMAPDRKAAAAATVFADRLSALIALLVMGGVAFVADPVPLRVVLPEQFGAIWIIAGGFCLALLGAAGAWLLWRGLRHTRVVGRIERTLLAARNSARLEIGSLAALLLAFALHCLNFFIFYCFCRALHLSISYPQILLMMPVLLFIVMVPVTINGHGLRELLLIAYFTHFGVTIIGTGETRVQEIAVAVSLLGVANDLLWSIPGGLWYFARSPELPPGAALERS